MGLGITAVKSAPPATAQGVNKMEETKWCPAHGYPLPCDKCGYTGKPKIKMEELKLENPCDECMYQRGVADCDGRCDKVVVYQADQQVVDKLKAEITQLKEDKKAFIALLKPLDKEKLKKRWIK